MRQIGDRYRVFLFDLVGRIVLSHRIDPVHVSTALNIGAAEAAVLIERGELPASADQIDLERLERFANFLVRLEWRVRGSADIRRVIEVPLHYLGGRSPADLFGGSTEDIRPLRGAVDAIEVPQTKWWRVGHK